MKILSSSVEFSGRVFRVRRDEIEHGDMRFIRDVVEHPGSVAFLPETEDDDVILIHQYRHPARSRILEVPAGTLKSGEDPVECVRRELLEETGYTAGEVAHLGTMYLAPGYSSESIGLYHVIVSGYLGAKPELGEDIIVMKMTFQELFNRAISGSLEDAKTAVLTFLVATKKGYIRVHRV